MSNEQLRQLAKAKINEILARDSFQGEVERLREWMPFLTMSYLKVKLLWEEFSSDRCASWLIPDDDTVRDFIEWIGGR